MTTSDRRAALVTALPDDVDAVLVTKLVNVRYLTGFNGSNAAVVVRRSGDAVLATDGRYREQAAAQAPDVRLVVTRNLAPDLMAAARGAGARRLAIERHHVPLSLHDKLIAAADGVDLADAGELVESLRT